MIKDKLKQLSLIWLKEKGEYNKLQIMPMSMLLEETDQIEDIELEVICQYERRDVLEKCI